MFNSKKSVACAEDVCVKIVRRIKNSMGARFPRLRAKHKDLRLNYNDWLKRWDLLQLGEHVFCLAISFDKANTHFADRYRTEENAWSGLIFDFEIDGLQPKTHVFDPNFSNVIPTKSEESPPKISVP